LRGFLDKLRAGLSGPALYLRNILLKRGTIVYYGNLKKCDIANGVGVRVTLFVSGCTNHCPDCFQPQTWDFHYGKLFTDHTRAEIFAELDKPYINGLTVLGGEPFEPENQRDLLPLLQEVRRRYPDKSIWCFTGFRLEDELLRDGSHPRCQVTDRLLSCIDVLVDGRFVAAEKDISLQFRGSRNQRVLDLPKTLAAGQPVIWEKLEK
jgi:anaerobic ribonucleoside-triphosphate reductase activating protein